MLSYLRFLGYITFVVVVCPSLFLYPQTRRRPWYGGYHDPERAQDSEMQRLFNVSVQSRIDDFICATDKDARSHFALSLFLLHEKDAYTKAFLED